MLQLDWNVLWTIVNVLILFAALRIFLWKPVQKIIEKRQNTITDSLTKAKQAEADATKKKEEYEASINNANEQALEILATAKSRAQAEYEAKIEAAEQDAKTILANAQIRIENERTKAIVNAQAEIATIALLATEKLLEKNIDSETNSKLIKSFLVNAGTKSK